MTNERRVLVHPDKASLASSVSARFITKMLDILDAQAIAHVVLTGGSMGSAVLEAVAASPARTSIDWSRVHFWWGDERWVPDRHHERNDEQARSALLDDLDVPEGNVHPFPTSESGMSLDEAADAYAAELSQHGVDGLEHPIFDITFLGVGPDGHIASLFPHRSGIQVTDRTVIAVRNAPKPPPERQEGHEADLAARRNCDGLHHDGSRSRSYGSHQNCHPGNGRLSCGNPWPDKASGLSSSEHGG